MTEHSSEEAFDPTKTHYPPISASPEERSAAALEKIAEKLQGIEGVMGAFLMIEEMKLQQEEQQNVSPMEKRIADVLEKQKERFGL